MKEKKTIQISLPYELAGKLSQKIKDAGFKSITEYVVYILEQTLSSEESDDSKAYSEEDEKNVRERLKELGYL